MKVLYQFSDLPALLRVLDSISDTRELALPDAQSTPKDGDWVQACFRTEAVCCQVAARSFGTGETAHLTFEDRDWERLLAALRAPPRPDAATTLVAEPQVLIVDHDADTCQIVGALLGHARYKTSVVHTPEGALDQLKSGDWQLVIADCHLAGMSSSLFCRRIRDDARHAGLPILLMSTQDELEVARLTRSAEADDFIIKPFRAPELIARSAALLES